MLRVGRTIPSYRIMLEHEIREWRRFSNALRMADRELFGEMMDYCRLLASESGAACRPIVSEAMFMAILFTHQKMLKEIVSLLERLNAWSMTISPDKNEESRRSAD